MIDGLYLVHIDEHCSYVDRCVPEGIQARYDVMTLLSSVNLKNSSSNYAFTIGSKTCYVYPFEVCNEHLAIILTSFDNVPKLFVDFLEDARNYFQDNDQWDAECRFNVMWTLLRSWREENDVIYAYFFKETRALLRSSLGYSQFQPYNYFKKGTDYTKLWKNVLLGNRILVTSNRAEDIAPAVFSLIGLVAPFSYESDFSIDLTDNPSKTENYKIVGALSSNVTDKYNYDLVISVSRFHGSPKDTVIVRKKGKLLRDLMVAITDRNLETDPYHELVGRRVVTDDVDSIMCNKMKEKTMTFNELRQFECTPTFELWNKNRMFRKELRTSFLSLSPSEAVSSLNEDECIEGYERIVDLLRSNQNDEHFRSVLRKHRRSIEAKMGTSVLHSSDSSDTAY